MPASKKKLTLGFLVCFTGLDREGGGVLIVVGRVLRVILDFLSSLGYTSKGPMGSSRCRVRLRIEMKVGNSLMMDVIGMD